MHFSSISDAQGFFASRVITKHYGYISQSTDLVWKYTTPSIAKTNISCQVNGVKILSRRSEVGAPTVILGAFVGRATVIEDRKTSPYRIGFKLKNITSSDANDYFCFMSYEDEPLNQSRVYRLIVYGNYGLLSTEIFKIQIVALLFQFESLTYFNILGTIVLLF